VGGTAASLRRRLTVWTILFGVAGIGLLVAASTQTPADAGLIVFGLVGVVLALVTWGLRVWLAYQEGRAD
jgi:hypothetical protein